MTTFSDWQIANKIMAGATMLSILLGAAVLYALLALSAVRTDSAGIAALSERMLLANDAYIHFDNITTSDRDQVFAASEAARQDAAHAYDTDLAAGRTALTQLIRQTTDATDAGALRHALDLMADYERLERGAFAQARAGKRDAAYGVIAGAASAPYNQATDLLDKTVQAARSRMQDRLKAINYTSGRALRFAICGVVLGFAAGFGLLAWLARTQIARPVRHTTATLIALAAGDLGTEVAVTHRADEIGAMTRAAASLRAQLRQAEVMRAGMADGARKQVSRAQLIEDLAGRFDTSAASALAAVAGAGAQLHGIAGALTAGAEAGSSLANAMTSATEQAASNVQTVAAATTQLTASIAEISRQVHRSNSLAKAVDAAAVETNRVIQGLAEEAGQIGDVVRLISAIAGQTNLLALNATIEAARAGDAGKGFAVVAAEVKSLASQTARATDDISRQINDVQAATAKSVGAMGAVMDRIHEINDVIAAIATAVEEQTAATAEIARNIQDASGSTSEVAGSITAVARAARQTGEGAGQVLDSVTLLAEQSTGLKTVVERFLRDVRAA